MLGGQKTVAIDARMEAEKRLRELRRDLFDIDAQVRAVKRNQSLNAAEKMQEILRLERDFRGLSWNQIADKLGVGRGTAERAFRTLSQKPLRASEIAPLIQ